jgi:hypothetical protein
VVPEQKISYEALGPRENGYEMWFAGPANLQVGEEPVKYRNSTFTITGVYIPEGIGAVTRMAIDSLRHVNYCYD